MAAKRTSELIPLCHPLPISSVSIDFEFLDQSRIGIKAEVKTTYLTGVEMEALTAVSVAALTIYDMVKAVDKAVVISQIQLDYKAGGESQACLSVTESWQHERWIWKGNKLFASLIDRAMYLTLYLLPF